MGRSFLVLVALLSQSTALLAQGERGWLGLEVRCTGCEVEETGNALVWSFSIPPLVGQLIRGAPAATAGLLPGDTILEIDGVDITTEEGGRRFGALKAGVPVELRVRRGGGARTLTMTPNTRSEVFAPWPGVKARIRRTKILCK